MAQIKSAKECYNNALNIKPDYSEALYNLFVVSQSFGDAFKYLNKACVANPKNVEAKIVLAGLKAIQRNNTEFHAIQQSSLKDHPYTRSFSWVLSLEKPPHIYFERYSFYDAIIKRAVKSRPFYEFGVWRGQSFNYLLRSSWSASALTLSMACPRTGINFQKGSYSSHGDVPELQGGEFIKGKFEDTLPRFSLKKTRHKGFCCKFRRRFIFLHNLRSKILTASS